MPLATAPERTKRIALKWDENFFEFGTAALSYRHPEENRYQYMLEGVDKEWYFAGAKRGGRYSGLPYGAYTLRVRGSNNDGLWSDQEATLAVIVTPPWWGTWWFRGGVVAVVLALGFNGFRIRFRRIEQRSRELERQVSERTHELKTTVEDLERSNRELDEFAYAASHDLKEPLRGIHNYASFLREDYGSQLDEVGRGYLERMQRLAERLTALIDGLLAYSRLGSAPLALETVDMEAILDGVAADLEASLASRGVELRRVGRLPSARGSAERIGEIFQNLIDNAAKYNDKAKKWVEVGCDTSGPVPVFYVRDNGIGIPEQHRESVFRIFKRLHEQSKFGGGTGVGLAVVKKIVERHGGRIWLESTPGEGTSFHFTLSGDT